MTLRSDCGLDLSKDLVISIVSQGRAVKKEVLSPLLFENGLFFYALNTDIDFFLSIFKNALHYLDRFWLIIPNTLSGQRLLWKYFYQFYSPQYERIVNRNHNYLCLFYFKQLIKSQGYNICNNEKILDFGCGTGFSAQVFPLKQIIGYDINDDMRMKAKKRGLTVINQREFDMIQPNSIDGCVACYVFHMALEYKDVCHLARIIKRGGFVVANYYKGLFANEMTRWFLALGFDAKQTIDLEGRFGSVYFYKKQ